MIKNPVFLILALFLASMAAKAQCPSGITFFSQKDVDEFQAEYPDCMDMTGNVMIAGKTINDLSSLGKLKSIDGNLLIVNNPMLESLSGLHNLTEVTGNLYINQNAILQNLEALSKLERVGKSVNINSNSLLTELSGLENLNTIGSDLKISGNNALITLQGLNFLSGIGGSLSISENNLLANINGIESLSAINRNLDIYLNLKLNDMEALHHAMTINGTLSIYGNESLSSCVVRSICDYLGGASSVNAVIHSNAPGCGSVEEVKESCKVLSVQDQDNYHKLVVFIDPLSGILHAGCEGSDQLTVIVRNYIGAKLFEKQIVCGQEINIPFFPRGIYFVQVAGRNITTVRKVINAEFIR